MLGGGIPLGLMVLASTQKGHASKEQTQKESKTPDSMLWLGERSLAILLLQNPVQIAGLSANRYKQFIGETNEVSGKQSTIIRGSHERKVFTGL